MKIKIYQIRSVYTNKGICYVARDENERYLCNGVNMDDVITEAKNTLKGETFVKDVEIGE